jgi:hypothetical protein
VAVLPAVLAAVVCASSASAAAPRYIFVSGACVPEPVLLADWWENHALVLADTPRVTPRALRDRPQLRVSLFWGVPSARPPTRPRDANQFGWFYPAHGRRAAVMEIARGPRRPLGHSRSWCGTACRRARPTAQARVGACPS